MYHVTVTKTRDLGSFPEGHPIFKGYTLKGSCRELPNVGEPWQVLRSERNGIAMPGIFTTTPIVASIHWSTQRVVRFSTANSEYRVEYSIAQERSELHE